jgi:acyl dehydratase
VTALSGAVHKSMRRASCGARIASLFSSANEGRERSSMPETLLYLEDFPIGRRFAAGPIPVSEEAIIAFAKEFDPQPFHTDAEAAKHSIFKGLAASGWHTLGLTMRLLVENGPAMAGGWVGFGAEVSWTKPVRPGDELSVECEVIDVTPSASKPNQAIITFRMETTNQKSETVQVLTTKNLAFKRGYAPGDKT